MAFGFNGSGNFTKVDAFGRPYKLVSLKKNKKGYPVGYVEIGGSLYKIDVSNAKPTDKNKEKNVMFWCKLTKLPDRPTNISF